MPSHRFVTASQLATDNARPRRPARLSPQVVRQDQWTKTVTHGQCKPTTNGHSPAVHTRTHVVDTPIHTCGHPCTRGEHACSRAWTPMFTWCTRLFTCVDGLFTVVNTPVHVRG